MKLQTCSSARAQAYRETMDVAERAARLLERSRRKWKETRAQFHIGKEPSTPTPIACGPDAHPSAS